MDKIWRSKRNMETKPTFKKWFSYYMWKNLINLLVSREVKWRTARGCYNEVCSTVTVTIISLILRHQRFFPWIRHLKNCIENIYFFQTYWHLWSELSFTLILTYAICIRIPVFISTCVPAFCVWVCVCLSAASGRA